MNVDEAIALVNSSPWACACHGGPTCCVRRIEEANALLAGARVAVDMMKEVAGGSQNQR